MPRRKNKVQNIVLIIILAVFPISCAHKSGHDKDRINQHSEVIIPEDADQTNNIRSKHDARVHAEVTMRKEGGVYLIPIIVNGLNLDFIFDTGASSISLSLAEATVMAKQGKITKDDVVGQAQFTDANGNISLGIVVLLHTVQIGGIVLHNVEASIVDNIKAPLLLGQSALAKFGKVTIDYNKNTIEFN